MNWASIREYRGRVTNRIGPKVGKASEISYDVIGFCDDGTSIALSNIKPHMRPIMQPAGDEELDLYAADPGARCTISVVDGQVQLEVTEAVYASRCDGGGG